MKPIYKCPKCGKFTEVPYHCGVKCTLILDPTRRLKLSKLLSGLLRHFPEVIGLELDKNGFTKQTIDELV